MIFHYKLATTTSVQTIRGKAGRWLNSENCKECCLFQSELRKAKVTFPGVSVCENTPGQASRSKRTTNESMRVSSNVDRAGQIYTIEKIVKERVFLLVSSHIANQSFEPVLMMERGYSISIFWSWKISPLPAEKTPSLVRGNAASTEQNHLHFHFTQFSWGFFGGWGTTPHVLCSLQWSLRYHRSLFPAYSVADLNRWF